MDCFNEINQFHSLENLQTLHIEHKNDRNLTQSPGTCVFTKPVYLVIPNVKISIKKKRNRCKCELKI